MLLKTKKILLKALKKESQKGSLLSELMIGLLISVLTVMVVTYVFTQFEEHKRITTQVSQTIANNALAVFPLQTYTKMAGYGFNNKNLYGCNVQLHNSATSVNENYILRPVHIEPDFDSTKNDRVTIMLGSSNNFYTTMRLMNSMASSSDPLILNSRFGVRTGDVLLVSEPGKDCSLVQATNLPIASGSTNEVDFSGFTYIYDGLSFPATFNKTGAHGIIYNSSSEIGNFGRDGKRLSYYVENGDFIENNRFTGVDRKTILGTNVVAFKAIYALDTDDDGNVDNWTNVTPANDKLEQIIGLKYALISRSNNLSGNVCNITVNPIFKWFGGDIDLRDNMGSDWGCYRYRMIQGTAPLKNMLWTN